LSSCAIIFANSISGTSGATPHGLPKIHAKAVINTGPNFSNLGTGLKQCLQIMSPDYSLIWRRPYSSEYNEALKLTYSIFYQLRQGRMIEL